MNIPSRVDPSLANAPVVAAPTSVSAQALAQREATRMQAAMLLARTYPRDEEVALKKLLKACTRTELAEEALYEYAKGGNKIEGPSIRLAEEMQRCWGSILCGVEETRGTSSSEWRSFAWDLETLSGDEKLFTVKHWRDTKQGGYALSDERDIYEVGANMAARRKRACILSCIPKYIQDAAEKQCRRTLETQVDITPERVATMLDAFKAYNVTVEMIEKRLQRRLDAITPAGMVLMRNIYNSLRDGVGNPADFFEGAGPAAPAEAADGKSNTEKAKEHLRAKRAADTKPREPQPARKTDASEPAAASGQSAIPFYDAEGALTALKVAVEQNARVACWARIFKDYVDTHRTLPNSIGIEALQGCTTYDAVAALWKAMKTSYREADLEMPVEVEARYHERAEVLSEQDKE